jgi:hypothetical protein
VFNLIALVAIVLAVSASAIARAQSGSSNTTSAAIAQQQKRIKQSAENFIEQRSKSELLKTSEEFVGRRLEKGYYLLGTEVSVNRKKVNDWIDGFEGADLGTTLAAIRAMDYASLREFLTDATVNLDISNRLSKGEWQPVASAFDAYLQSQSGGIETLNVNQKDMPPPAFERAIELQAAQQKKLIELESQKRREENKAVEDELKSSLEAERSKVRKLNEQLLTEDNIKDRIIKERPLLTRFLATGMGITSMLLVALVLLGILIVLGFRAFGVSFVKGAGDIADALRNDLPNTTPKALNSDPKVPEGERNHEGEEIKDEFDTKQKLSEAADLLKVQVLRDLETTAALLLHRKHQAACAKGSF